LSLKWEPSIWFRYVTYNNSNSNFVERLFLELMGRFKKKRDQRPEKSKNAKVDPDCAHLTKRFSRGPFIPVSN